MLKMREEEKDQKERSWQRLCRVFFFEKSWHPPPPTPTNRDCRLGCQALPSSPTSLNICPASPFVCTVAFGIIFILRLSVSLYIAASYLRRAIFFYFIFFLTVKLQNLRNKKKTQQKTGEKTKSTGDICAFEIISRSFGGFFFFEGGGVCF